MKSKIAKGLIQHPLGLRCLMYYRNFQAWQAKKKAVGSRSLVARSVKVAGWSRVRIGTNSLLCDDTWLVANHDHPSIFIGNHCFIGARNFFSSGARIDIGDFTLTAPGCSFLGAFHDYSDPFIPQMAAPVSKEGVISVGANCSFGAGVIVLADSRIGHGSVIGAGAVIKGIIPSFSLVVGNPGRVIKRFDPTSRVWTRVGEYTREAEDALPLEEEYRASMESRFPDLRGFPGFISRDYGDT